MPLSPSYFNITEPAKYTNVNPLDFRVKNAQAQQAEAVAAKYHQSAIKDRQAQELQKKRGAILLQASKLKKEDGSPASEEEKMRFMSGAFLGIADDKGYFGTQKQIAELEKNKLEQQKMQAEAQEKKLKIIAPIAFDLEQNPSDENITHAIKRMGYMGLEQEASMLKEMWEQNRNAPPEQRSQWFGQFVPKEYRTLVQVDTGTEKKMVPNVGKGITSFGVNVSPNTEAAISSREKIANQRSMDYRERTSKSGGRSAADRRAELTAGLRWNEDGTELVPIKGGKVWLENKKQQQEKIQAEEKRIDLANKAIDKNSFVIDALDRIMVNSEDWSTTGLAGAVAQFLPQTKAWDQVEAIKTVEAHVSFSNLDDMRKASKTGGALGSIAVRELDLLGALHGSLSIPQKQETFRRNAAKMLQHYVNADNALKAIAGRFNEIRVVSNKPLTEEQYLKLPYGTWYIKPNGTKAVKSYPKTNKGIK